MNFAGALFALQRGHKVKRRHWTGYWTLGTFPTDNIQTIIMHTWDGKDYDIRSTKDIMYTLSNMACDDWEIIEDWDKDKTQPDYQKDNAVVEDDK